jgi:hypothetical protein
MVVNSTPTWSAPRSGLLGDPGAVDASAQGNQLLGTHTDSVIYQGSPILTPFGTNFNHPYPLPFSQYQYDQPFTMSGTTIGRVAVPVMPVGTGADLIVTLSTDNAGIPGTVINQTRVPAAWIYQLSAITGSPVPPASSVTTFQYTNSPLALAQFNSLHINAVFSFPWAYPTIGTGLTALSIVACYYGNYFVVMGGNLAGAATNGVYTIAYDGVGDLSQAIPQQSLPTNQDGTGAAVVSIDPSSGDGTVVITGGAVTTSGAATNIVYTASLDTNTGDIASWSTQTVLPFTANNHGMAAYNGYVYVTGGSISTATAYGQVSNGQITAWTSGPPLPAVRPNAYAIAINGFLFIIGGFVGSAFTSVYYAAIASNGSLGPWQTGPSTPVGVFAEDGTTTLQAGDFGIIINSSGALYTLSVSTTGPDIQWLGANTSNTGVVLSLASSEPGLWQYYGINYTSYSTTQFVILPRISVPLPTSGLTNGSLYHITLAQAETNFTNYLATTGDLNSLPGSPTFLYRANIGGSTWLVNVASFSIPITIYSNTVTGPVWHTWEDSGNRISTIVSATTPDQRIVGLLEATSQPAPILNMWPNFSQDSMGPWTPTGGTAAPSTAQTHFQLPYSALVTPTGSAASTFISSEFIQVLQFHAYTLTSYWYSPTGFAHCAVNIGWYDATKTPISTTSGTVTSVAANTWTALTVNGSPPGGAVYAVLVNIESSTPAATAVFYVATSVLQDQSLPQVASVCEINYTGTWPSSTIWPATGVTQLA